MATAVALAGVAAALATVGRRAPGDHRRDADARDVDADGELEGELAHGQRRVRRHGRRAVRTDDHPAASRSEADAVAAKRTLTVASGGYSGTLDLPHRALPGTYLLRVVGTSSGIALTPVEATLTLPAPPEGIVDKASVGLTAGGKAIRKVKGSVKQLYGRFHFLVAPKLRTAVRLVWRTPQFNFVGEVRKRYSTNVRTFVKSGQPLPKGTWYCLLTVNEIVVKRVSVRVT